MRSMLIAVMLVVGSSATRAQAAPQIEGPASAPGDPARSISLVLRGAKPGKHVLRASAGRLSEPRPRGTDWVFELTPPRVAISTEVVVEGAGAPYRLRVDPLPPIATPEPSEGPIFLEGPASLVLGTERSAALRIRTPDGAPPMLRASRGTVSDPTPGPDGSWVATFTAPKERTPAIAIVAAWTDDGEAWGWLRIPLIAIADVKVETEPDAVVVLRSGAVEYGPFQMGKSGRATFPVHVPPAVQHVRTEVVGAGGQRGARQSVDLQPPPFERLVAGYAAEGARIFAFALDPAARPATVRAPIPQPTSGRIGDPRTLGPGVTAWPYEPAPDAAIGDRVPVTIAGPDGATVVIEAIVRGRPPSGLRLALDPPVWTSGSEETVAVVISFEGDGAGPLLELPVEVEVDHGEIAPPRREEDGRLVARWSPGDRIADPRAAVRARADALAATGHLELRPGPASRLDVRSDAERLRADGISRTRIVIEASDAAGNPIPAERLVASAGGSLGTLSAEGRPGAWVTTYTAPRRERIATDLVEVRADGVEAHAPIALWPSRPRLLAGAALGFVSNFGRVAAPMLTAQASVPLPFGGERLYGGLESGLYGSRSRIATGSGEDVDLALRVLPVLAVLQYRHPAGPTDLVGSASAGVFVAETAISSPSTGTRTAVEPYPGVGAALGAEYPVGIGRAFVETGYWHARAGGRVRGSLGGLRVTSGYRLQF